MEDFLKFRKMITPVIIQVLFWVGVAFSVIGALITMVIGLTGNGQGYLVLVGLVYLVLGPALVRIYCELLILFFRMNETLTEIKNNLAKK
ncbi:MAG: DUF4282 domain-containing protein [Anaerolineaceae bacterium]|nr:DUF4282 domain-containing protein [Anaerolineaceae bacterium]